MHTTYSSRFCRSWQVAALAGLGLLLALSTTANAHAQAAAANTGTGSAEGRGRILLVLPFDNRTGQPSLEWIREAAPEILSALPPRVSRP